MKNVMLGKERTMSLRMQKRGQGDAYVVNMLATKAWKSSLVP